MKKNNELIDIEFDEVIELESPVEVVEEYLDVDNSLVEMERNKDLIRMEMNIVEYPIFSKNKRLKKNQIMKYHFKTDGSAYIEVTPLVNRTIPGEFEERVFISLTKIMRDNGYGRSFYTTPTEIIRNLGEDFDKVPSVYYKKVKEALNKMNESNYKFKNSLYSNEYKKTLEDEIKTNIMNIRIISKIDAGVNEKNLFEDGRVKEVYKISFSDYFYENIVRKGYLVFNSEELLKIKDAVTRSVYTQITKWRNNKLYLKRPAFYIARRIPLKWDKKNLARTVKRMEESCILLKNMGFLKDYRVIKNKKWEQAEFEFFFDEEHNRIQQENFFKEREDFRIAYVEEKDLKETEKIPEKIVEELPQSNEEKISETLIEEIFNILPPKAKELKTMRSSIVNALKNYQVDFVKYTAEYTSLYCKKSVKKYFEDALKNNWAEEYILNRKNKKKVTEDKKVKEQLKITSFNEEKEKLEASKVEADKLWQLYEEIDEHGKSAIEVEAYKNFLEAINQMDTSLNRTIFKKSKKSYIIDIMKKQGQSNEEIVVDASKVVKEPKSNEEKLNYTNINKKYESMSMFLFDVMKALEEEEIEDMQRILQIIPLLNEFTGTVGKKKIELRYMHDDISTIIIKPH